MALSAPAQSGDQLGPAEVHNHLLLVCPVEYVTGIFTVHTKPGQDPSDAIRVNVAVLTQTSEAGQHPVYNGVLWFNAFLKGLKRNIGETVLGRMVQGAAKPGQDPPWMLQDATNDPQAVAYAESWLAQHPEFEANAQKEIAATGGAAAAAPAPAPVPTVPVPTSLPATPAAPVVPAPAAAPAVPQLGAPGVAPAGAPPAVDPNALAALLQNLSPEERAKFGL